MEKLILQTYIDQEWRDMAELHFEKETYQLSNLVYFPDYITQYFGQEGSRAVSINYPVHIFIENRKTLWS
ncbi:type II toxin-antitoxin system HipA family toxin, partial [Avibacterium paragallinarum]